MTRTSQSLKSHLLIDNKIHKKTAIGVMRADMIVESFKIIIKTEQAHKSLLNCSKIIVYSLIESIPSSFLKCSIISYSHLLFLIQITVLYSTRIMNYLTVRLASLRIIKRRLLVFVFFFFIRRVRKMKSPLLSIIILWLVCLLKRKRISEVFSR